MMYFCNRAFLASIAVLCLASCITTSKILTPAPMGFVAVGDTGYVADKSGMTVVSSAVHNFCTKQDCQFGLMAGDNIYPDGAAADVGDAEMFRTRFLETYGTMSALGETFLIYVALGNHDWRTSRAGALAQVAFHETTRPYYMDGLFFSTRPPAFKGVLEVFVIDTEMLLAVEEITEYDGLPDGSMVVSGKTDAGGSKNALPESDAERQQLFWFKNALKNSDAKWKVVLAHHPLWQSRSDSKYEQSIKLRELLLPSLCQYADVYVAGHQHTQELHTDSCTGGKPDETVMPLVHIVSGAGAKTRTIDEKFQQWQRNKYPQLNHIWAKGDEFGFSYLRIDGEKLEVRMISVASDGSIDTPIVQTFDNRP